MSTLLALRRMVSWSVDLGARAVDECAVPELQHEQHPDLVREVRLPTPMSRPERLHACGIEVAALASPARADRVLDVPGQIAAQPAGDRRDETVLGPVERRAWDHAVQHGAQEHLRAAAVELPGRRKLRSEERRVGKECATLCRSRW